MQLYLSVLLSGLHLQSKRVSELKCECAFGKFYFWHKCELQLRPLHVRRWIVKYSRGKNPRKANSISIKDRQFLLKNNPLQVTVRGLPPTCASYLPERWQPKHCFFASCAFPVEEGGGGWLVRIRSSKKQRLFLMCFGLTAAALYPLACDL